MIRRFASYYKPHKKLFVFDMLCAAMLAAIDLVFPYATRVFMNDFIPNDNRHGMVVFGIVLFGLIIVRLACNYFVLFWGHIMGARIEKDIRRDLFKKFQTLNFSYFDENQTGKIMSRLVGDLRELSELAHHGPEDIFISTIMFFGTFAILSTINLNLTLVMIPIVLMIVVFTYFLRNWMKRSTRKIKETQADINAQIENSIGGIRLMKSFNNEEKELEKFDANNERYYRSWFDFYNCIGWFQSGNNFLLDFANVALLVVGGFLVLNAEMSAGDMTAFFLYLGFLTQPIRRLIQFAEQFQAGGAGFKRFCEVMDIVPEIQSPQASTELENPKGNIDFKNVHFAYEEDKHVLNNFTLSIKAGEKVAFVGESGVGKSTLSQLIPRFYDVSEGAIKIDGTDVRDYDISSLRQAIGHVQQDVYIFYDNIMENIRYGNPEATDQEVYAAAKKANIHDFIMTLDEGYQTHVGERGVKLSGGQKQRIAIARVFLKNPKILILDEATSALDNITEKAIQEALDELAKGRTTITIAHRLSTIKNADKIVVLGKQGIAELGTHEELLETGGYYATLHG
ncbi:MAG: ABC transporter ATP-binding protein/permease [Turicibacter sp.]|nr:ABC transporter ATP-binding protein/permease [Turicibacter sp.]